MKPTKLNHNSLAQTLANNAIVVYRHSSAKGKYLPAMYAVNSHMMGHSYSDGWSEITALSADNETVDIRISDETLDRLAKAKGYTKA